MAMTDKELLTVIDSHIANSTIKNGDYQNQNTSLFKRYMREKYGNEKPGESQYVSNDVADAVDGAETSMVRIFQGSSDVMTFKPLKKTDEDDIAEAAQKTRYVDWQIREQDFSYKVLSGWVKDILIQKVGAVKYYIEESNEIEEETRNGYSDEELAVLEQSLEDESGVESVKITETTDDNDVTFKVKRTRKRMMIRGIPAGNLIFTLNATDKDDADVVGDEEVTTRGELLSRGFQRDAISKINITGVSSSDGSEYQQAISCPQGGSEGDSSDLQWASESVTIQDLYVKVDYDKDGIAERRHIIRSGNEVLINEVFNHVPYAITSSILMPHRAIGRSLAEVTAPYARATTALMRGVNNNIAAVNKPMMGVNKNVNPADVAVRRINGLFRTTDSSAPAQNMQMFETPYVGDKSLLIVDYYDRAKANTVGTIPGSQGLSAETLNDETASRFNGMKNISAEKTELVARNIAEGFRQLYEGVAWVNENFNDSETEIEVLGEELKINPADWKIKHQVSSHVGLGVGDNDKILETMTGMYQLNQGLRAQGSPLVDDKTTYNIVKKLVNASGIKDVEPYYNDPSKPDQLLKFENEQLKIALEQTQLQMQQLQTNPLAEAEQIKQETNRLIAAAKIEQGNEKTQLDMAKFIADQQQAQAKLIQEQEKINNEAAENQRQLAAQLTELELKYGQDVPGSAV